jgi:glycerophosphoryl diester phosphodiesterase
VYGGMDLHRGVRKLNPRIKVIDARDFRDEIIAVAIKAQAGIYVDRLGPADTPEFWEDAVRRGATGIQSDRPAELVQFLRSKGWHK